MYGGILFMLALALLFLSPVIWMAWWLIADLGETASGRAAVATYAHQAPDLPRAA